jgi:hypothetical protein
LVPLLGRKDFETEWLRLCRLAVAPPEVWTRDKMTNSEGAEAQYVAPGQSAPRLAAYAYSKTGNKAFLDKSIATLLAQGGGVATAHTVSTPNSLNAVVEDPRMSTNEAAQTGLQCIEVLELCKESLPTVAAVRTVRQPGQRPAAPPPAR